MPPRWLALLIVVFWLGTTAWFVWRDLAPGWTAGQPPPYLIDLADEADKNAQHNVWYVVAEGAEDERLGRAETWVKYFETEDVFELTMKLEEFKGSQRKLQLGRLRLQTMVDTYRVTRAGALLEARSELTVDTTVLGQPVRGVVFKLAGKVQEGRFHPTCRLELATLDQEFRLPAVDVSRYGSILQPLHPVNRIQGLRPGQTWRMPLFDPFADAASRLIDRGAEPVILTARVRPNPEPLPGQPEISCLVIDYDGADDSKPRTWVRASNGLVMRQEATVMETRLILKADRDLKRPSR
jgi:hypothetical protein